MKKHFLLFVLSAFVIAAHAANRYWIGNGTNTSWSNTANWSTSSGGTGGASIPGSSDIAIFDNNGVGNCDIDATVLLTGMTVNATYTGTISQGSFVMGMGTSTFSGGTFLGGTADLNMNGFLTISGTNFTSTTAKMEIAFNYTFSSGTFNHNNGLVRFRSTGNNVTLVINAKNTGASAFHKVQFVSSNGLAFIQVVDSIEVTDSLLFGYANAASNTQQLQMYSASGLSKILAKGHIRYYYNFIYNFGTTIRVLGSGTQTIYGNMASIHASGPWYGILNTDIVKQPNDTVKFIGNLSVGNNLKRVSGIADFSNVRLSLNGQQNNITGSFTGSSAFSKVVINKTPYRLFITDTIQINDSLIIGGNTIGHLNSQTVIIDRPTSASKGVIHPKASVTYRSPYSTGVFVPKLLFTGTNTQIVHTTHALAVALGGGALSTHIAKTGSGRVEFVGDFYYGQSLNYISGIADFSQSRTINGNIINGKFTGTSAFSKLYFLEGIRYITDSVEVSDSLHIGTPAFIWNGTNNAFVYRLPGVTSTARIIAKGNVMYHKGAYYNFTSMSFAGSNEQYLAATGMTTTNEFGLIPTTIQKTPGSTLHLSGLLPTITGINLISGNIDAGNSKIYMHGSSSSLSGKFTGTNKLNKLVFASNVYGGFITLTDSVDVADSVIFLGANQIKLNGGFVGAHGHVYSTYNFSTNGPEGTSRLVIKGTGNQNISSTATGGAGSLPSIIINKTTGTFTIASNITTHGQWRYDRGTVDAGTSTVFFRNGVCVNTESVNGNMEFNNLTYTTGSAGFFCTNTRIKGNLTIPGGVTLQSSGGTNFDFYIGGNWDNQGTFTTANHRIILNGTGNQTITKSSGTETFYRLTVNKTSGYVTLGSPITVTNNLTLTSGNIQTTATNLLTLNSTTTVTGGSNTSFIEGPVKKSGNTAFTFPLGSSLVANGYQPLSISAPSQTTDGFTAEYVRSNQSYGNTTDEDLNYLSTCEYWKLSRTGASNVDVTLGWNANSCNATAPANMRVAVWDGATWKNQGNAAYTGTTTEGTVKSTGTISNYIAFTTARLFLCNLNVAINSSDVDNTICAGESVTLTASGATSYTWTPVGGLNVSDAAQVIATPVASTTYSVIGTDALGCADTAYISIIINNNPVVTTSANPNSIPEGSQSTLSANGAVTYVWYPSNALITSTGSEVIANPLATTTYTVIGTDANGCSDDEIIIVEVVQPESFLMFASLDVTICPGTCATLSATGADSYNWFPSSGLNITTGSEVIATPTVTTVYTVEGTKDGQTFSINITVFVNPALVINAGGTKSVCSGNQTILGGTPTAIGGNAPYSYSWTPSSDLNSLTESNPVSSTTLNKTYTLTVTDHNGCTASNNVSVVVHPLPIANAGLNGQMLVGDTYLLGGSPSVSNGTSPYTYTWLPSTNLDNASIANPTTSTSVTTTYSVTVNDAMGCSASAQTSLVVDDLANARLRNPAGCSSNNITIAWTTLTGMTLDASTNTYTKTTTNGYTSASATSANLVYTNLVGSIKFKLTNQHNGVVVGFTNTNLSQVANDRTVSPPAGTNTWYVKIENKRVELIYNNLSVPMYYNKKGAEDNDEFELKRIYNTVQLYRNGNILYPAPGQFINAMYTAPADVYAGIALDKTGAQIQNTTVDFCAPFTISAGNNQTICSGSNVTIGGVPTATGYGTFTYAWSPSTGLSATNVANPVANPTSTNAYNVIVTNSSSCCYLATTRVNVNPSPAVSAGSHKEVFYSLGTIVGNAQPVISGGTAPFNYTWSPATGISNINQSAPVATPLTNTNYSITVTDSKGCTGTDNVNVIVKPTLVINTTDLDSLLVDSTETTSWSPKSGILALARAQSVSFTIGDKVYVGTGEDINGVKNDFYEYDPTSDTWTPKANFPGTSRKGATAFVINGKGYVMTGEDGSGNYLNDVWEYNPTSNTWAQKANFSGTARTNAVAAVANGFGYIATGKSSTGVLNDVYQYIPSTDTWIQKANFIGDARQKAVAFTVNDNIYIATGQDASDNTLSDIWVYDNESDEWIQKENLPGTSRFDAVSFTRNFSGYIGTGVTSTNAILNDVWEYNALYNTWSQKTNYTGNAIYGAVGFSVNNEGYIATGFDGSIYKQDVLKLNSAYTETVNGQLKYTLGGAGLSGTFDAGGVRNFNAQIPASGTNVITMDVFYESDPDKKLTYLFEINSFGVVSNINVLNPTTVIGTNDSIPLDTITHFTVQNNQLLSITKKGITDFQLTGACSDDFVRNWVETTAYDENGLPIAESRSYFDDLGKPIQAQSKIFSDNNIIAQQNIYDFYGRPSLTTLPVPINQQDFCFKAQMLTNKTGSDYGVNDYDKRNFSTSPNVISLGEVDNPKPVNDLIENTVGWYYSNRNSVEPYVATSSYPYARIEYDDNNGGSTKRSSMPGDKFKMGSGHEPKIFSMPASGELHYVFGYNRNWLLENFCTNNNTCDFTYLSTKAPNYTAVKNISIDENGTETVVFYDLNGNQIASGMVGSANGANMKIEKVNSIIKSGPGESNYIDIHLPKGCETSLRLYNFPASAHPVYPVVYNILDLKTGTLVPISGSTDFTGTTPNLPPGVYRIIRKSGGNLSQYPVEYNLNYYNFSANYYDKRNRLIYSVPPAGFDHSYNPSYSSLNQGGYDYLVGEFGFTGWGTPGVFSKSFNVNTPNTNNFQTNTVTFTIGGNNVPDNDNNDYGYLPGIPVASNIRIANQLPSFSDQEFTLYQKVNASAPIDPSDPDPNNPPVSGIDYEYIVHYSIIQQGASMPITTGKLSVYRRTYDNVEGYAWTLPNTSAPILNSGAYFIDENISSTLNNITFRVDAVQEFRYETFNGWRKSTSGIPISVDSKLAEIALSVSVSTKTFNNFPNHKMLESNTYNSLNWVLSSTSVDQGVTDYVYRKDGSIRFTQNQIQRESNANASLRRFSYVNYDDIGRIAEVGEFDPALVASASFGKYFFENHLQANQFTTPVAGSLHNILESTSSSNIGQKLHPNGCTDKVNYMYDVADPSFYAETGLSTATYRQQFMLGKISKVTGENTTTWFSYDELGRMIWQVKKINGMPDGQKSYSVKTVNLNYDYNGNIIETAYQKEKPADRFYHYYTYDRDKRLTQVHTSRNGINKEVQASYYFYKHGPLKRVELANGMQGVDYVYTINGWLKSMNAPEIGTTRDPGKDGTASSAYHVPADLFGMSLDYFNGDYIRQGTNVQTIDDNQYDEDGVIIGSNEYFNGIIKAQRWKTAIPQAAQSQSNFFYKNNELLAQTYYYDKKYQLLEAQFGTLTTSGTLNPSIGASQPVGGFKGPIFASSNNYKTFNLTYDLNGNIKTLNRNGHASATPGLNMDQLDYKYLPNTNQLDWVDDNVNGVAYGKDFEIEKGQQALNYRYDKIGRLTNDALASRYYKYDVYDQLRGVYADANHTIPVVDFIYDAAGKRLRKRSYTNGVLSKETWYDGQIIFEKDIANTNTIFIKEIPVMAPGRIATYFADATGPSKFNYELSDNQGNVRTTFTKAYDVSIATGFNGNGTDDYLFTFNNTLIDAAVDHNNAGSSVKTTTAKRFGPLFRVPVTLTEEINASVYFKHSETYAPDAVLVMALEDENGVTVPNSWVGIPVTNSNSWTPLSYLYKVMDHNPLFGGAKMNLVIYPWNNDPTATVWFDDLSINFTPTVNGIGGVLKPSQLNVADYYPHGSVLPGRNFTSNAFRFGYQGQFAEKDPETGFNSFELRQFDALLGRWVIPDPMRQYFSPYLGMGNNPINTIDPTGGEGEFIDPSGNKVSTAPWFNPDGEEGWTRVTDYNPGNPFGNESIMLQEVEVFGVLNMNNTPGGKWDMWGVGSKAYHGDAFGGTNFIGPGPDVDPASLGLEPIDEIDFAAYIHDREYYRHNTGGYSGAKNNLDVAFADLQLLNAAYLIRDRYLKKDVDQITGKPISQRTFNLALVVIVVFDPIVKEKYRQLGSTPNIQYSNFDK